MVFKMSIKSLIIPRLAERTLSHNTLLSERYKSERKRQKNGTPHLVEFFHGPANPYSQLLQAILPDFEQRYNIELKTHGNTDANLSSQLRSSAWFGQKASMPGATKASRKSLKPLVWIGQKREMFLVMTIGA